MLTSIWAGLKEGNNPDYFKTNIMGLFSEKETPRQVTIKGKKLKCTVCENDIFQHRKAQLNTKAATLMNIDWANKSAHCYVCQNCSHIEWFLNEL